MKKLFTIVLLVLGGVVSAQADVVLAGNFNNWNGENHVFTTSDNNVYTLQLDLSDFGKNTNFKVVDEEWLGATNLTLVDGTYNWIVDANSNNDLRLYNSYKNYTFTYNKNAKTLKVERSEPRDFIVTGNKFLLGSNWKNDDDNNKMTTTDDLVFTKTISNIQLAATTYEYKIIADHSWGNNNEFGNYNWDTWSFDNFKLTIGESATYDVTFTLDLRDTGDGTVTATATKVSDDFTDTYTLVGAEAIAGSEWASEDTSNDLTDNGDGTYSISKNNLTLNAVKYEYKIIKNHLWGAGNEFGKIDGDAVNNADYTINEDGVYDFTFTLNPTAKTIAVEVKKVITLSNDFTTIASKHDLDWTDAGATAYYATVNNDNKVVLKKFEGKATSGTGLLLKRTGGDVVRPTIANAGGNAPANNKLVGVTDATTVGEGNNYVLSTKNGETGFYRLVSNVTIPAGRAYLHTDAALATVNPGSEARVAWVFEDEDNTTTGIEAVSTAAKTEGIFNLSGQRVAQPQKGLYIVNGKKVVMK